MSYYCCNECKNLKCDANRKNAKKNGVPVTSFNIKALCGSNVCAGYKRP